MGRLVLVQGLLQLFAIGLHRSHSFLANGLGCCAGGHSQIKTKTTTGSLGVILIQLGAFQNPTKHENQKLEKLLI